MTRLTPMDIFNKDFKQSIRGYDVQEVNEFLDIVIRDFEELIEENKQLKEQLKKEKQLASQRKFQGDESQDALIQDILHRLERLERMMKTFEGGQGAAQQMHRSYDPTIR